MSLVIVKWKDKYENNRTRELKKMDWVPVPNRMDGEGYTELVDHPNGAAHLGGWLAILEIASRQEVRGTIPQDGAALCAMLSRISRLPRDLFEELIPRLQQIEWIEAHRTIPQDTAGIPQGNAGECLRARAGASVPFPSVPFSSVPEEKTREQISKDEREVAFQQIVGIFSAAGVMLTEGRIYAARGDWDGVRPEEFPLAIALAQDRARKNEPRFMGYPSNFIRGADWRARGPGRILPDPLGKNDIAQETAERNFMRKRGMCV